MREIPIFCSDPSGFYHNNVKEFKWTTTNFSDDSVVVYTDKMIMKPNKIGKVKIAWIFEPEEINPSVYQYIRKNYYEFDYIFTWVKDLLTIDPKKFHYICYGTSWIHESKYDIYPKNKLVSIVASSKRILDGHKLRHDIIKQFSELDVYGKGYNPVESLLTVFKDHMFTIVIENVMRDCNISEKLITPLLCGTIPIFYGCPSIGEHFDKRGLFQFNNIEELRVILESLTPTLYDDMLPFAKINFELAKNYQLVDDTLFLKLRELNII